MKTGTRLNVHFSNLVKSFEFIFSRDNRVFVFTDLCISVVDVSCCSVSLLEQNAILNFEL